MMRLRINAVETYRDHLEYLTVEEIKSTMQEDEYLWAQSACVKHE